MPPKQKTKAPRVKAEKSSPPRIGIKRERTEDDDYTGHGTNTAAARSPKSVKNEEQECDICAESKTAYRNFPKTHSCKHDATVCTECYKKHFVMRMEENRDQGWSACSCPLCGEGVSEEDARGILPRTISKEIDAMINKTAKQNAYNWLWCPAPLCGHGQLHNPTKQPWVKCSRCKTKICFSHQRKWHKGLACAEFDAMSNKDEAMVKDMEEIRRTTKPCPYCRRRVQKDGGCNHMACTGCKKHWMWDDVPFDGEKAATNDEMLGKRGGAPSLIGEHREAVGLVIRYHNAEVDRQNAEQRAIKRPRPASTRLRLTPMQEGIGIAERGFASPINLLLEATLTRQRMWAAMNADTQPTIRHGQQMLLPRPRQPLQGDHQHRTLVDGRTSAQLLPRTARVHTDRRFSTTAVSQNEDRATIDLTLEDTNMHVSPRTPTIRLRFRGNKRLPVGLRRNERPTTGLVNDPIDLTKDEIIDLTADD